MTQKELCSLCTEYSIDTKCENKNSCKILAILKENKQLKEENTRLKKENKEMRIKESWEKFPDAMGK